jgi:hypothetical protein
VSVQNRCEATNQANVKEPSVSRVQLRVFFPPQNLEIEVERPEKNPGYDRTTDYAWITSSASLSVRKKFLGVVGLIKLTSLSLLQKARVIVTNPLSEEQRLLKVIYSMIMHSWEIHHLFGLAQVNILRGKSKIVGERE